MEKIERLQAKIEEETRRHYPVIPTLRQEELRKQIIELKQKEDTS